jgi:large exoprotein involved in heme utilization and adhesion
MNLIIDTHILIWYIAGHPNLNKTMLNLLEGNVQVNTIGINPANALNELPSEVVDSSTQIADRCGNSKTSSFVATGRG